MRSGLLLGVLALLAAHTSSTQAGPHLGMKLACKRYGEAWNSGDVRALQGVATRDFYEQWQRMPASSFAKLPRGGSAQVLSTQKGNGSGTVTVSTRGGAMTFLLVGGGFDWRVADIFRAGDDGQRISVKEYLDLSLTASEFMEDLKYKGGSSFHDSISHRFRSSFRELTADDLARIRNFLPEIERQKPNIRMSGIRATLEVPLPGGKADDRIIFAMVKENSWKVDDYKVDCESIQIASFREALPVLASVTAFSDYTKDPSKGDLAHFTSQGSLRSALAYACVQEPSLLNSGAKRDRFEISPDLETVNVCQGGKNVQMKMVRSGRRFVIDEIQLQSGDRWMNVAQLINLKRRVSTLGVAFANLVGGDEPAAIFTNAVSETSSLAKAKAPKEEPAIRSAAAQEPVKPTQPEKELVPAVAETQSQSRYHYVQPATYSTQPQMKREYRQWKRSMRRCQRW